MLKFFLGHLCTLVRPNLRLFRFCGRTKVHPYITVCNLLLFRSITGCNVKGC